MTEEFSGQWLKKPANRLLSGEVTLLHRLKTETLALHLELEQALPLGRPDLTLAQYGHVLQAFSLVVPALEQRLQALELPAAFQVELRLRAALLRRDLHELELAEPQNVPSPQDWSALNADQALGALYVLEGSRLGGGLIARSLVSLGVTPEHGGAYFTPDTALGQRWKAFQQALVNQVQQAQEQAVVDGARLTFRAFLASWHGVLQADMVTG